MTEQGSSWKGSTCCSKCVCRTKTGKACGNVQSIHIMALLRKHTDLSQEEIRNYQQHADLFAQDWIKLHHADLFAYDWIKLHGNADMANYVHLWTSGHFMEYLQAWGTLYPHSQQGWEAFNALLNTFYFRCANRRGSNGQRRANV